MPVPASTDPPRNINELLLVLHCSRLILNICNDYGTRITDPIPESLRRVECQVRSIQDVTSELLTVIEPEAITTWPYYSSLPMERRLFWAVTECESQLNIIHELVHPLSIWMSPDACPIFAESNVNLEKCLTRIEEVTEQLKDCLRKGDNKR
jgi:hypothetical protein